MTELLKVGMLIGTLLFSDPKVRRNEKGIPDHRSQSSARGALQIFRAYEASLVHPAISMPVLEGRRRVQGKYGVTRSTRGRVKNDHE